MDDRLKIPLLPWWEFVLMRAGLDEEFENRRRDYLRLARVAAFGDLSPEDGQKISEALYLLVESDDPRKALGLSKPRKRPREKSVQERHVKSALLAFYLNTVEKIPLKGNSERGGAFAIVAAFMNKSETFVSDCYYMLTPSMRSSGLESWQKVEKAAAALKTPAGRVAARDKARRTHTDHPPSFIIAECGLTNETDLARFKAWFQINRSK